MDQNTSPDKKQSISPLKDFLAHEMSGGIVLVAGTLVALLWANSPWKSAYHDFWATNLSLHLSSFHLELDLRHWVNDGLMTIFFFVVGLEIKRETTSGHLASRQKLMLPLVAAFGGMAIPAFLYLLIAGSVASHGWGVPMATDIALALGVLSTVGNRIPESLRAYLLGLAVVDDIAAIIVIAIFYSSGVSGTWLLVGGGAVLLTVLFQKLNLSSISLYVLCGAALWYALHEAGVHATIAGVIMGLLTPTIPKSTTRLVDAEDHNNPQALGSVSVLEWLEHLIHPWSAFFIIPIFAIANAGIEISTRSLSDALSSQIAWGVLIGLVLGKPLGIFIASMLAKRTGIAHLPSNTTSSYILGVGQTAGIGFTVAIFISELAFTSSQHREEAKMAILCASIIAAMLGVMILRTASSKKP